MKLLNYRTDLAISLCVLNPTENIYLASRPRPSLPDLHDAWGGLPKGSQTSVGYTSFQKRQDRVPGTFQYREWTPLTHHLEYLHLYCWSSVFMHCVVFVVHCKLLWGNTRQVTEQPLLVLRSPLEDGR